MGGDGAASSVAAVRRAEEAAPRAAEAWPLPVAVVLASRGRPADLDQLLDDLALQTQPPSQIILSVTRHEDLPPNARGRATVVIGDPGLCAQRNRGLEQLEPGIKVVAFFDDDYMPRNDALEAIATFYRDNPSVVAAHGRLLADGIGGPGITVEDARALLTESHSETRPPVYVVECDGLYGCNMTFRVDAIGAKRFDERLKLYGWQEDIDFSAQFLAAGRVVSTSAFVGVHRGAKGARMSGRRFGYSQVVNPAYLVSKGTMKRRYALKIAFRNIVANFARAFLPEPWIDRRGRLIGNFLGLRSLLFGRAEPERVIDVS